MADARAVMIFVGVGAVIGGGFYYFKRVYQPGQALAGGHPVAVLGAVLGGGHDQPPAHQPGPEPGQQPGALGVRERGGRRDVVLQLDPRVGGVHRLPAGAGGAGEPLDQLAGGDHQAVRESGAGRHHELVARPAHRAVTGCCATRSPGRCP